MAKQYKIIVNSLKGEETIDLAAQNGRPVRIEAVKGANYLLQSNDEKGAAVALKVKARRAGKDLQLMFDDAPAAQVVLAGYYDVALENHTPLLGRMPDGSLREYTVLNAQGSNIEPLALSEGGGLSDLVLANPPGPVGEVAGLAPLVLGPGALVALVAGAAAVGAGGGGTAGTTAPVLPPDQALKQLQTAAQQNTASDLTVDVYKAAGVSGVTDVNLGAVNDVLNTAAVTGATLSSKDAVQKMVDASLKVFNAADHLDGNLATALTVEDFSTLAVTGVTAASAKMLSDVIDGKAYVDVDTVAELQALADASLAVIGYTTQGIGAPTLSQINGLIAGLPSLGNVVVTREALSVVQNAILANNTDANGPIASQSELAGIVKSAMGAFQASMDKIFSFASVQKLGLAGQAIPPESIPTLVDYNNVGVTGVSQDKLGAFNDALASEKVDGGAVLNPTKLQAVIDAYNTVLAEANGSAPDASPGQNPSASQYAAIGADIGTASADAQDLALLNDAVGAQTLAGVDTIAEINNLARITNAIQAMAAGQAPNPALTVADFAQIGLNTQGLSDNNPDQKAALFRAIAAQADDGSQTDSLSKLQAIIQSVLKGSVAPVVLDMNGDGALSYTTLLRDVNGDGQVDRTAWAGPQDGVLVRDADGDGRVNHPSEFAFARHHQETDLQGLAALFDTHRDGVLDAQDAAFGEFKVWQDANGNGVSDAGELHTLHDLGVVAIDLHSDGAQQNPAVGVTEMGRTFATRMDGTRMLVADAAFDHTSADVHASPLEGGQWRLEVGGERQTLDLSNLRAVFGDVRDIELGGKGHHTLNLKLEDVLAQPLQLDGDASTVVALCTGGQAVTATPMQHHGVLYQTYDFNQDGDLDLWVQHGMVVQTH